MRNGPRAVECTSGQHLEMTSWDPEDVRLSPGAALYSTRINLTPKGASDANREKSRTNRKIERTCRWAFIPSSTSRQRPSAVLQSIAHVRGAKPLTTTSWGRTTFQVLIRCPVQCDQPKNLPSDIGSFSLGPAKSFTTGTVLVYQAMGRIPDGLRATALAASIRAPWCTISARYHLAQGSRV